MAIGRITLDGKVDRKTIEQIKRSLRAHRGALAKLTRYTETAANAATIMPTEKGCSKRRWKQRRKRWKQDMKH